MALYKIPIIFPIVLFTPQFTFFIGERERTGKKNQLSKPPEKEEKAHPNHRSTSSVRLDSNNPISAGEFTSTQVQKKTFSLRPCDKPPYFSFVRGAVKITADRKEGPLFRKSRLYPPPKSPDKRMSHRKEVSG